jgi:hypothetical protein
MQQAETQLIYWTPSRVRFNLTLILALAVILFGIYQLISGARSGDDPPVDNSAQVQSGEGETAEEGGGAGRGRGSGGSWLLIIVGLGVGGYSWLTSPRQYRVYSDALVIMYGTPRSRQIHFSQIREVVNDRGFMGDPLRVYTVANRRIPLQVREPEELQRALQTTLDEFRRAYPQYAPPAREEDAPDDGPANIPADVVESTADEPAPFDRESAGAETGEVESTETGSTETESTDAETGRRPERRSRRRSLRDDGYDSNQDDSRPRFS